MKNWDQVAGDKILSLSQRELLCVNELDGRTGSLTRTG
jgi:hypothetical protein